MCGYECVWAYPGKTSIYVLPVIDMIYDIRDKFCGKFYSIDIVLYSSESLPPLFLFTRICVFVYFPMGFFLCLVILPVYYLTFFFNLLSFFGLAPFLIGSWSWRDSEVILSISYLPFFILFAHMYVCKWSWWGKAWSFFRVRVCKSESRELFRGRYLSEDRGRSERG